MEADKKKKKDTEVITFTVPLALKEVTEDLTINTNNLSQKSKEQIINQAINFQLQGNISEATKYYKSFINMGFQDYRVFSNYGSILQSVSKLKDAELYLRKAIELNSNIAEVHYNLGNVLKDLGKLKDAEVSTRKAIELKPNFAMAYFNLGMILRNLGQLQDAGISYRKAIELKPDYAEAHSNLGNLLRGLGELKDAEISLRKAIELKPNYAKAYFNLSLIELLKGNYQSGLENYEFRFKTKNPPITFGTTKLKRVNHQKLQQGEKLLVISEQGLGDTLQYMRYVPYLRSQGLDVAFSAQTKLHSLIKSSGIDQNPISKEESSNISEGQWIPLLSLPRYLKVTPENPIINKPYIYSTNALNQKWKNIFANEKKPIVGINWQGNPEIEKLHYQGRSLPLEAFSILADNNEVSMLSLQKGFGSEQLDHCSFKNKFVECQPQIDSTWDFLENAAIIENCDLIITCDTSIAHLAGGMGKQVWLLLRDIPFWTWGLTAETTFWYPSMRLFRQKERHNWAELMERVSSALKNETKD